MKHGELHFTPMATFTGLTRVPFVALSHNSLFPSLTVGSESVTIRVVRRRELRFDALATIRTRWLLGQIVDFVPRQGVRSTGAVFRKPEAVKVLAALHARGAPLDASALALLPPALRRSAGALAAVLMAVAALAWGPAEARDRPRDAYRLERFDTVCLTRVLSNCRVSGAGFLNGERGGPRIAWQTQTGFTPERGVLGGVVLMTRAGGRWTEIGRAFDAFRYATPRLTEDGLLHVAGRGGGSGAPNADLLYRSAGRTWHRIDIGRWRDEIAAKLPEGLSILQGVDYDFEDRRHGLTARTPLWRRDDANGGPTGGQALVVFRLEDRRLVIERVQIASPDRP